MADRDASSLRLKGATAGLHRIAPEMVAEAQRLVETTSLPQKAIAEKIGVHQRSVGRLMEKYGWRRPGALDARRKLVGEIRRKVESEIGAAERALAGGGDPGPAARTLASLVKTLRELARFDEEQGRGASGGSEDFDGFVADPDAFREALAERLEKLRDEREP